MAEFLGLCAREPKLNRGPQSTNLEDSKVQAQSHEAEQGQGLFSTFGDLFGRSGQKKSIKLDGDTWMIVATDVTENIYLYDVEPFHNIQLKKCTGGCSVVASQAINKLIVTDCKDFRAVVLGAREVEFRDTQDFTVDFRGLYVPTALNFQNSSRCVLNLPPGIDPAAVESTIDSRYSTAMYYRTADGEKIALTPAATTTIVKGGEARVVSDGQADAKAEAEEAQSEAAASEGDVPPAAVDQQPVEAVLSMADEFLPVPVAQTAESSAQDTINALSEAAETQRRGAADGGKKKPAVEQRINERGEMEIKILTPPSSEPRPPPALPGRPGLSPGGGAAGDAQPNTLPLPPPSQLPPAPAQPLPPPPSQPLSPPMRGDIAGRYAGPDPSLIQSPGGQPPPPPPGATVTRGGLPDLGDLAQPPVPSPPAEAPVPWFQRNLNPDAVPPLVVERAGPGGERGGVPVEVQLSERGRAEEQEEMQRVMEQEEARRRMEQRQWQQEHNLKSEEARRHEQRAATGTEAEADLSLTEVPLSPEAPQTPAVAARSPGFERQQTFKNVGTPVGPEPLAPEEFQG